MLTITPAQIKMLTSAAEIRLNITSRPLITLEDNKLIFTYPLHEVPNNAVDSASLEGLRLKINRVFLAGCQTMWVGIHDLQFRVWTLIPIPEARTTW